MAFNYVETTIVKGMLARGDKQHDIAAYFGENGGRVAEVSTGDCAYPNAPCAPAEKLPPPGPYLNRATTSSVCSILRDAIATIVEAGDETDEAALAVAALEKAIEKLDNL
ncbi:hypothetical protein LGT41_0011810 [Abyssibius alkaniclasticus]|uniref:hypothetical protein n=1 Tax=Abyssibius alkaniclasticus TaxID=2881234 RepID=UPI00236472B5|nr:hypothetical protein [Abyssibius alkaniclasticus]UPH70472.1 hypothetical protein LGT41_0011810 [Abyssibius alkaniclasticus]